MLQVICHLSFQHHTNDFFLYLRFASPHIPSRQLSPTDSRPSQTIPLRHLSGTQIWQQLSAVAGEDIASALEEPSAPKAEATDAPAS